MSRGRGKESNLEAEGGDKTTPDPNKQGSAVALEMYPYDITVMTMLM